MLTATLSKIDNLLSFIDNIEVDEKSNVNAKPLSASASESFKPQAGSHGDKIVKALAKLNINFTSKSHKAVFTSEEHIEVANDLDGIIVKNIFVKEKRKATNFLVVMPATKSAVDLKALGMYLGVGGGLRFVQDPTSVIEMEKGSITPLAVLFDANKVVQVYVDDELSNASNIVVHPGTNTASICIKPNDLELYCKEYGNGIKYINLNQFIGDEAKKTLQRIKEESKNKDKKGKNSKDKPATTAGGNNNNKSTQQDENKDENIEGITKDKYTQFGDWYKEIVTKCELIDYTDISGCYVLRPLSYSIWEKIQHFMDTEIKKMGVANTSFPLFVSEAALNTEKKHVEDFTPEVAWVTHSGDTELENRIAVRPTSETIMYPMFARWIRSYHDLPLKINQWCNIVRWEFKNPTPFLRTREFLWQEGHTAWETQEEAIEEVYQVLDMYARTYEYICAVPTIKGVKTDSERFPGADLTTTVESYIPGSGRGIQGATSHCLGTHFSAGRALHGDTRAKVKSKSKDHGKGGDNEKEKKEDKDNNNNEEKEKEHESNGFNITYLDKNNVARHPIQNSWGFTTRSIGVMIMNHSDNKGLVLPPRAAQWQVVIIPIHFKNTGKELTDKCNEICNILNKNGISTFIDSRETKNPGYKFNEWELKGVPIRIEIGPKDMKNETLMAARRDKRDDKGRLIKVSLKWLDIEKSINKLLNDIHDNLYNTAKERLAANVAKCENWNDLLDNMFNGKLVLAPHCNNSECEELVGKLTKEHFENLPDTSGVGQTGKAKALCIPLENTGYQPKINEKSLKCVVPKCKHEYAQKWILFGRSY